MATTPEHHAKTGGTCCPACGSEDIEGQEVTIEAGIAFQDITCNECDSSWTDEYTLTGYDKLEDLSEEESCQT